jgi:GTP-binding protein EngB required for normal cell division
MIYRTMFRENQQRYLLTRFHSIDKRFSEALAELQPADDGRLFATHIPDATLSQRQVLSDYVAQLRFLLRRFLHAQSLLDTGTPISMLWRFRVATSFMSIATEELRPEYLRGYGEVDVESAAAIERLVADMKTILRRMAIYLDRGEGEGLAGRLAQLDATVHEIELLRELDRIIAAHGLIELRVPLEQLVERAASPRLEVAVFGRVNSGKSSLLNWWVERPLLPTGVTPITAVPTRIVRGDVAAARVTIAGSAPLNIPLERLPEYITEDGNPANSKRVLDIEIRVPAARLMDGLCLVDTPGLGSLATAGAAQTLEYLPRCDVGLVLVEAGGVISREDLDVARAILDGGAELVIALSKADRLSDTELALALDYARRHLSAELHSSIPVQPISTLPTHTALAERWFAHALAPRLTTHHQQGGSAIRRKIGALREAVIALIQARLISNPKMNGSKGEINEPTVPLPECVSQARAEIEHERQELSLIGLQVQNQIDRIIGAATDALTQSWKTPMSDAAAIGMQVEEAIAHAAYEATDELAERLKSLRHKLQQALHQSLLGSSIAPELPLPRGRPQLDTAALSLAASLAPPRGLKNVRLLLNAEAKRRLERHARRGLAQQLAIYGEALRHWGSGFLEDMASQFDSALAVREGSARIETAAELRADDATVLHNDLERLQHWSKHRSQSLEN